LDRNIPGVQPRGDERIARTISEGPRRGRSE
jgi:hypothetical protein